ncbi:NAD-dependent epimerase/dehydratase family protein [Rhodobacteraceae bacterium D3-12]|nr:NAD-dependent epimerase/dehydratase family protein [Rhodobacteraceae bacterium D3-12]
MTLPNRQTRHVLVLGASGKLGRMLRRAWELSPPEGLTIDWQYRENAPEAGRLWRVGEAPLPALPRCDAILALWGVTPGAGRDLAENRRLALAAMDLAEALGATRVLHCSSAAVYEPGPVAQAEAAAGGAINAYGAAKLEMETALSDWRAAHPEGAESVALRIANVVGADSLFAAIGRGADPITLDQFADGEGPWRSYISPLALARAFATLLVAERGALPRTLNIAAPAPVAMEALARAAGCDVAWREAPESAAPMVSLDTRALGRIIALAPETADEMIAAWRQIEGGGA